jgi:tetratricopeptide (TPR) repeat protein/WD40 repeat protein
LVLWNPEAGTTTSLGDFTGVATNIPYFGPAGRYLQLTLHGDDDAKSETRLWEAATGRPVRLPEEASRTSVRSVQFGGWSEDERRVLAVTRAAEGWRVAVWDVEAGSAVGPPVTLAAGPELVQAGLSADGRRVLTAVQTPNAPEPTELRLWDVETGAPASPPVRIPAALDQDNSPWPSADMRHVAYLQGMVNAPEILVVVNVAEGTSRTLPERYMGACFSPDGRRLLTWGGEGTVEEWDADVGEQLVPALNIGSRNQVSASFSLDGRKVLTYRAVNSWPYNITVATLAQAWDADTGSPLTPPMDAQSLSGGSDRALGFKADGERWLAADGPAVLEVHDLAPDARPAEALSALARVLAGRRVNAAGTARPLEVERLREGWEALRRNPESAGAVPLTRAALDEQQLAAAGVSGGYRFYPFAQAVRMPRPWPRRDTFRQRCRAAAFAAVWRLDRLIAGDPADGRRLAERGLGHAANGNWDKAAADYERAAAAGVGLPAGLRGEAAAERGRWAEAASFLRHAVEDGDKNTWTWENWAEAAKWAEAQAAAGDRAGYAKSCAALAARSPTAGQPYGYEIVWVVRACSLGPAEDVDFQRLADVLEKQTLPHARDSMPGMMDRITALGIAYYRAGRYDQALQRLTESAEYHSGADRLWDWLFLAMTCRRLGRAEAGRKWLEKAAAELDEQPAQSFHWTERLELETYRHEAETLLKQPTPDPHK